MNETNSPDPKQAQQTPPASSEDAAVQYIETQLAKTRTSLKNTNQVGVVLIVIVLCYISYVSYQLKTRYVDPKPAAQMLNERLMVIISEQAPQITGRIKKEIPHIIQQIPEIALQQLPKFRIELEKKIADTLSDYSHQSSQQLGEHLDMFLKENKDEIHKFMEHAEDKETIKELGAALEEQFKDYLKDKDEHGESIQNKIDSALKELRKIEHRVNRLATANDLTPAEKKLRYAIAAVIKTTQENTIIEKDK